MRSPDRGRLQRVTGRQTARPRRKWRPLPGCYHLRLCWRVRTLADRFLVTGGYRRVPSVLEAFLLGLVQGLTEFIPVSSSGHLVLADALLGLTERGLAFDVALHVGTLGAVIVCFRAELLLMAQAFAGFDRSPDALLYRRLGLLTVVGSIPVGIAGLLLEDVFEDVFGAPVMAALFLLVTAAVLFAGERFRDRRVAAAAVRVPAVASSHTPTRLPVGTDPADPTGADLAGVDWRRALIIGAGQCLALLPGVSRSGTTIATGMAAGLTREAATRFSFLLLLPALVGAAAIGLPDLGSGQGTFSPLEVAVGVLTAFVSGYLAIRFLIALVSRDRLTGFAWYCLSVGLVALAVMLAF